MPKSLKIVVGITGGIAAYKAVGVVRGLVKAGHDVHVIPTESALRFVGAPTLEAMSRNPISTSIFDDVAEVRHVALGQQADLIIVAPATANTIAKLAAGIADDLLGTTILASHAPIVLAPAMHTEMWENAATVANVSTLRGRGIHLIGPAVGQLTGTDVGAGRMSEPGDIVEGALAIVAGRNANNSEQFAGLHLLISAGGTREPLDPVRFLGNRSSGKQGLALAQVAAARGARITFVAAHVDQTVETMAGRLPNTEVVPVGTAAELNDVMRSRADTADVIVMAAAVADYRPADIAELKIKKEDAGDELTLQLVKNPDILAGLASTKRPGQTVVGFAAETATDRANLLELGRAKAKRKGADLLVLNRVGWSEGFGTDSNTVVVVNAAGDIADEATGSKRDVAEAVLDAVLAARA
ncbi:bifunctional phosphopantothenoylcysteine decarboxylase/phosphopantothenate--cysteine ligase CoaBC [Lysinibacter cavernae]|uniref:Coenzyme A biosynthesis bifunctional protein CoaBC n=1 Tax=Lysinibacter cavernae TaxID=1640652 RepID=A0A7X5TSE8_9MICO|nr:bifunctional phosphopantothenoylcysteine decarboxylase/phosphopantothenate--cysteine ligase CoaBC [Lysinibacter cavernae]NIH52915.1 phosphopantothenoylcysteine decarboxylase/phosphopantothenate--cysteine ligase [Lysinibacter cavernae]